MYFVLSAPGFVHIGVFFFFFLFNISTGEVRKTADDAVLHLEVLWNKGYICMRNKQLWGMV